MEHCNSCDRELSSEMFINKGKVYKTCSRCLTARAEKRAQKRAALVEIDAEDPGPESSVNIDDIDEYVARSIAEVENDCKFTLYLRLDLDDETLVTTNHNVRSIVCMISDRIEEGDGYVWT